MRSPSPVIEENFSSKASISLSRPPSAKSPPQITSEHASTAHRIAPSPTHSTHSSYTSPSPAPSPVSHAHPSAPVAPPRPRGRKSRPTSIDSVSQEELLFLVEELQGRETVLKRRILDLEAITDVDLPQRVDELEKENRQLQETLSRVRSETTQHLQGQTRSSQVEEKEESYISLTNPSYSYAGSDNNNRSCGDSTSTRRGSRDRVSMLEKPGEVLQQRVKELEHLDSMNRNQVC